MRPVPLVLLPRPYPQFLPYLLEVDTGHEAPRLTVLDGVQFSVSKGLFGGDGIGGSARLPGRTSGP
jgi:hypothetical protein